MAAKDEGKTIGDTPAPYCKLSRKEARLLALLDLSGMESALYMLYASERRPVKGKAGLYCTTCGDARAAAFLDVERVRALRLRRSLVSKGAIACASKRDGRTPTRIFFPMQNAAILAHFNAEGVDLDSFTYLEDHLEDMKKCGLTVSSSYNSAFGRVNFNTSDVQNITRVETSTPPVQERERQTCEEEHAGCVANSHARRADDYTSGVQLHEVPCTGIRIGAQVAPTNDDLCTYEPAGGTCAAAGVNAAATPPASDEGVERRQPELSGNALALERLGIEKAHLAHVGDTYYLCPKCSWPMKESAETALLQWYQCIGCGYLSVVAKMSDQYTGGLEDGHHDHGMVPTDDIDAIIAEIRDRGGAYEIGGRQH